MSTQTYTCPMPRPEVIDNYFLEHRAKVLDIAAFLDRVDRSPPASGRSGECDEDFRITAMKGAIRILLDDKPERARRVQEVFSDHSTKPIDKAPGKGASGAVPAAG